MSPASSSRKLKALCLLAPAVLALNACESHNTVEINTDGSMVMTVEFTDTDGMLSTVGMTCDDFKDSMNQNAPDAPEEAIKVEDISANGVLACRMTMDSIVSVVDDEVLTETEETFVLNLDGNEFFGEEEIPMLNNVDVTLDVNMPGGIVDANTDQINGNVASYTGMKQLMDGVQVEGYKSADKSSTSGNGAPSTGNGTTSSAGSSDSGVSPAVWVLGGLGILGLIGLLVFFMTRKKKNDDDIPQYGGQPHAWGSQESQQFNQSAQFVPQPQNAGEHLVQQPMPFAPHTQQPFPPQQSNVWGQAGQQPTQQLPQQTNNSQQTGQPWMPQTDQSINKQPPFNQ